MSAELTPDLVELDALLRRASASFPYPETPAIAQAVTARLSTAEAKPAARWLSGFAGWLQRPIVRPAFAVASTALIVVVAVLAVPTTRYAVAEFFGLRNVRVEVQPPPATPAPTANPAMFARPVALAEAQASVVFPLRFPTRDGAPLEPDRVYLHALGEDATVIFVYEDQPFDLYQSQDALLGKGVSDSADFEEFQFDGLNALWFPPGDHLASFLDVRGTPIAGTERTVERATLLWEQDGVTYRLETSLSQTEAIEVAQSLR